MRVPTNGIELSVQEAGSAGGRPLVLLHALGESIHGLLDLGFLTAGEGRVRSLYQILPVAHGWVACDLLRRQGEPSEPMKRFIDRVQDGAAPVDDEPVP